MSRIKLRDARRDLAGLPGPKDPADIEQLVIEDLNEADTARLREVIRGNRRGQMFHQGGLIGPVADAGLLRILPDGGALPMHVSFDPALPGSDRTVASTVRAQPGAEPTVLTIQNVQVDWSLVDRAVFDDEPLASRRRLATSGTVTGRAASDLPAWHALQEAFRGMGRAAGRATEQMTSTLEEVRLYGSTDAATRATGLFARNSAIERAEAVADEILHECHRAWVRESEGHNGPHTTRPEGMLPTRDRLLAMLATSPYLDEFSHCLGVVFWGLGSKRVCIVEVARPTRHRDEMPSRFLMFFLIRRNDYRARCHDFSDTQEYNRLVGETILMASVGRL